MKTQNDLKLTTQADLFYHSQPTPTDHDEMMQLMADFAEQFAEKILKQAAKLSRDTIYMATRSKIFADNFEDIITALIEQHKG